VLEELRPKTPVDVEPAGERVRALRARAPVGSGDSLGRAPLAGTPLRGCCGFLSTAVIMGHSDPM